MSQNSSAAKLRSRLTPLTKPLQPPHLLLPLKEGYVSTFIVSLRSKPPKTQKVGLFALSSQAPQSLLGWWPSKALQALQAPVCCHTWPVGAVLAFRPLPPPLSHPRCPHLNALSPPKGHFTSKGSLLPSSPSPSPRDSCPSQEHMENSPGQWLERQKGRAGEEPVVCGPRSPHLLPILCPAFLRSSSRQGGRPEGEAGPVPPLP